MNPPGLISNGDGTHSVVTDRHTGRVVDKPLDLLPSGTGSFCDDCGTELINRCYVCGAPVCCPKCCDEATQEAIEDQS